MSEINAVTKGLKIVRDGNFFRWKDEFYNQISGCALGDIDSCSYCDLAMAYRLDTMVSSCEEALNTQLDPFFKIFRNDALGMTLSDPSTIPEIKSFLMALMNLSSGQYHPASSVTFLRPLVTITNNWSFWTYL